MAIEDAPVNIGLLWHSASSRNLGVGALTVGDLALVREAAAQVGVTPRFHIMGMRDKDRDRLFGDDVEIFIVDGKSLVSPGGFWKVLGELDLVLDIGAGDSFSEIYGPKRFGYLWLTKMMTAARGVPLIFAPQTIGPFNRPVYRTLASAALRKSRMIFARDEGSAAMARALAPAVPCMRTADVAFTLPYQDRSASRGRDRLRIGINAAGLMFHEAEMGRNQFGLAYDYASFTRRLIAIFAERPDAEVHLISHCGAIRDLRDDDHRVAERLSREFPQVIHVPEFATPSEAKSYISSLDFLVSGRMHACIAAFSAGTPVVPVAYSPKFHGTFEQLDYRFVLGLQSAKNEQEAIDFVLRAFENRSAMIAAQTRGMKIANELLDSYREGLRDILAAIKLRERNPNVQQNQQLCQS